MVSNLKSLRWILGVVVVAAFCYGVWAFTTAAGRERITQFAREQSLCNPQECGEGLMTVTAQLAEKYDLSPTLVPWCVGVDRIEEKRVRRLGWLKYLAVSIMDLPCGDTTQ